MSEMVSTLYVGSSEAVAAECTYHADAPFTLLEFYDNEPVATVGFDTLAEALAEAREAAAYGVKVVVL